MVQILVCHILDAKPLSKPISELLLLETLGTNFSEILIEIEHFSFIKVHLKTSYAKFSPGGDE